MTRQPNRQGKPVGTRDFFNSYKHLGGTKFNRDTFGKPYHDLMIGLRDVCIHEDRDLPLLHMKKYIGVRNIGFAEKVDWKATNEMWRDMYPGKTRSELKEIKDKPLVKNTVERIRLMWIKGIRRGANRFYMVKNMLYYLKPCRLAKYSVYDAVDNGNKYLSFS